MNEWGFSTVLGTILVAVLLIGVVYLFNYNSKYNVVPVSNKILAVSPLPSPSSSPLPLPFDLTPGPSQKAVIDSLTFDNNQVLTSYLADQVIFKKSLTDRGQTLSKDQAVKVLSESVDIKNDFWSFDENDQNVQIVAAKLSVLGDNSKKVVGIKNGLGFLVLDFNDQGQVNLILQNNIQNLLQD